MICLLMLGGCSSANKESSSANSSPVSQTSTSQSGNITVSQSSVPQSSDEDPAVSSQENSQDTSTEEVSEGSKTLVVYFSRTGEQYGVGNIDKGNTAIVAGMIAEKTGADSFEILPQEDYYPYTYNELTDVAKQEQNDNARPAIKGTVPDLTGYDTVFIGAPVWWYTHPRIINTFFDRAELTGIKVHLFATLSSTGIDGSVRELRQTYPDVNIADGKRI